MACAGAIGALESLGKLDFAHVECQNQRWQDALEGHPAVRTVRRLGAFIAVELKDAETVQKVVEGGLDRSGGEGVLLFWFLSVPHAFRLAPPLTCTEEEMTAGLTLILRALDQAV